MASKRAGIKCSKWFRETLNGPHAGTIERLLQVISIIKTQSKQHVLPPLIEVAKLNVPRGSQWVFLKRLYTPENTGSQFMYLLLMLSRRHLPVEDGEVPLANDWTKIDADLKVADWIQSPQPLNAPDQLHSSTACPDLCLNWGEEPGQAEDSAVCTPGVPRKKRLRPMTDEGCKAINLRQQLNVNPY
jgi:hypothetical protein